MFVPGWSAVDDSGTTIRESVVFGSVVGRTAWDVDVPPGFQFGRVYAWDEGVPLASHCGRTYARSSIYRVLENIDCRSPQRHVEPLMTTSFRVRAAQLNSPGSRAPARPKEGRPVTFGRLARPRE